MTLATNANYYRQVGALLEAWGWGKAVEWWPGWATRTNSSTVMTPSAVTVHHTGGRATATSYLVNPADRPQLKVLANLHITHGHKIRFICAGGASHGGYTHEPCYQRVVEGTAPLDRDLEPGPDSPTFSINKRTVGIEVDGAGGPKEWDDWTYRAAVAVSAACQLAGGWPIKGSPRVGAHKEHTKRKPGDPYAPMGKFRRDVLACLATPWGPIGEAVEVTLGSRLLSKDGNDSGADVVALIDLLIAKGYALTNDGLFGPAVKAAVEDVQTKAGITVDGVVGPDTLAALRGDPEPEPQPEEPVTKTIVRVGTLNCLDPQFGGSKSAKRMRYLANVIKSMRAPLVALTEAPESTRDAIRPLLPGGTDRWKVWANGATAILYDSKTVTRDPAATADGRYVKPNGYQGWIAQTFVIDGLRVTLGAYHLQPNSRVDYATQIAEIQTTAKATLKLAGDLVVLAGDGVNRDDWLPGWTHTRVGKSANVGTYHGAITDRIHYKASSKVEVKVTGYGVRKTTASDHAGVVAQLTVTR